MAIKIVKVAATAIFLLPLFVVQCELYVRTVRTVRAYGGYCTCVQFVLDAE